MTILALLIARWLDLPGARAMPVFVVFMLLAVPLGELLEWASRRSLSSAATAIGAHRHRWTPASRAK